MSILVAKKEDRAIKVWFSDDMTYVLLADGREIGAPLVWFPKLLNASAEDRNSWRLLGNGAGIHWDKVDEDLSIEGLL